MKLRTGDRLTLHADVVRSDGETVTFRIEGWRAPITIRLDSEAVIAVDRVELKEPK